ncbi:ATP-binding protein [Komagataeibacter sp. FNDCR2]|uniref:ATP-binding protein n=1 Tax=Komagataeibacter sp. FNDCR2 TaxID=2878682 RepID=UPI001E4E9464|nr:ATP-binding protein [Komagataeibacter sp. FNDCR2]MCE2576706.1 ATP-binding protein [Komagataeibacter sp. FNDCR2]
MQTDMESIHNAFLEIDQRAERATDDILKDTFVDTKPLFNMLSSRNNQIIYGRRGTGKTHALKYLQNVIINKDEFPVYIDLRNVGSNGSIYTDPARPLSDRAATLISDVLLSIYDILNRRASQSIKEFIHPHIILEALEELRNSIGEMRISGSVDIEEKTQESSERKNNLSIKKDEKFGISFNTERSGSSHESASIKQSGKNLLHINFGRISTSLSAIIDILNIKRLWVLLDEWSEVPMDLQPYLSDLIRRTILPERKISIKIAAIEHRSNFSISINRGEYIGLELGADISANLNLDDFLVFDNDKKRSIDFFKTLLFKHIITSGSIPDSVKTPDDLVRVLFTQTATFEEFVQAVEGVPRDALNLMTKIVSKAWGKKAGMKEIRDAARDWYNTDKIRSIQNNEYLTRFLNYIVDEIIGNRKAKAFLVKSNMKLDEIDELFDFRVLHILKKNISSRDEPGIRYDAYKIDYGCYVELINTSQSPHGMIETEDGAYIDVPKDDYRAIRRAILNIDTFRALSK